MHAHDQPLPHAPFGSADKLASDRIGWRCQRVARVMIALLVVAAALGLFGSGPLSSATLSSEGASLEYQRFVRRTAPASLVVRLAPAGQDAREQWLTLGRGYLDSVEIKVITPHPTRTLAVGSGARFLFTTEPGSTLVIRMHIARAGLLRGEVEVGASRFTFWQFAWP